MIRLIRVGQMLATRRDPVYLSRWTKLEESKSHDTWIADAPDDDPIVCEELESWKSSWT